MAKTLIIAEKPSVANDIARSLGNFTKYKDFHESEQFIIASAVGHLLEIAPPDAYEVKRGKWSFNNLPVIPPHFELRPIAKTEQKLKVLMRLIKRKDINLLVNACDAGREGELIFRYIVQHVKTKLPIARLWLQSMTPQAIREGFKRLRSDDEMQPLANAARCRSEADWLVGINGTRALTAFNSKEGGFFLTTVGRVQTPTLSIVVEREEKIRHFLSRHFWEIKAKFSCQAGFYEGKWFNPFFKKEENDKEKRDCRLWNFEEAESIVAACLHQEGSVSEETKTSIQFSPALFDLTSLQREANARFGFSAKNTLAIAQSLYEKYKVLTYPRTDSRALPEDYVEQARDIVTVLQELDYVNEFAQKIVDNKWIKQNKKIFDNKKISDHFAIIPTKQLPKNLTEAEQKVYQLVLKRFLAVFFPPAEYILTNRITKIKEHYFKTEGKVMQKPGWLILYKNKNTIDENDDTNLVKIENDEKIKTDQICTNQLTTKPPARFTEATLLSAMEGAGKLIDNEDIREAMLGKGLGTPATRAAIIEGLLTEKYIVREIRELIPTAKAFQLLTLLRGLAIEELTHAELTGEWEHKLRQIEKRELTRETFMQQIAAMTYNIVKQAKEYTALTVPGNYSTLTSPCPNCGQKVKENYRRFTCINCDFSIAKIPGGRQLEIEEVENLLLYKKIGPLTGFRSKLGRPFSALLKLVKDEEINSFKMQFDFGQDNQEKHNEIYDFSGQTSLGPCPKCKNNVYEHEMFYLCEGYTSSPKACEFRSAKVILNQDISKDQMIKLLTNGRTDLLDQFKSARTGRTFKAYLICQENGKISFEFEKKHNQTKNKKINQKKSIKDKIDTKLSPI